MSRYHQDEESRILGERHAGIVINEKQVLLVHRIKAGYEYYVFPGGHRRFGEEGQNAVTREVYEETGVVISSPHPCFEFRDYCANSSNYYYLCDFKFGDKPHMTGEEKDADPNVDFFDPMWVNLSKIDDFNILPKFAKYWLLDYLKQKM